MARLESEGVHLRKEWQSLQEIAGSALTTLSISLTGHPLKINIPSDLPLLHCDGVLIERVLVNLLENGCKYAGKNVTIGIDVAVHSSELQIIAGIWGLNYRREKRNLFLRNSPVAKKNQPRPSGVGSGNLPGHY